MVAKYEQFVEDKNATPFVITRINYVLEERLKNHSMPLHTFCEFATSNLRWYADAVQWKVYSPQLVEDVCTNSEKYYNFNKTLTNNIEDLKIFSKSLYKKNLTNATKEEIWNLYLEGTEKYEKVYEYGIIPTIADLAEPFLSTKLKNILKKHSASSVEQSFVTLTTPHTPSVLMQEEIKLMQLALDSTINASSLKIKKHHEEFYWLTFGYEGPLYSTEEIWHRLEELRKNSKLGEALEEKIEHFKKAKENSELLIKKLKLDEKIIAAFQITREWILLKEARKASFFACYAAFDQLAKQAARLLSVPKMQVKYLTKDELSNALFENKMPKDVDSRKKHSIYTYENGKDVVYTGKDALEFVSRNVLKSNSGEKIEVIKGQIAYPGIVIGTVKLIREPRDMAKMNNGDVLISPATNPNILPAMNKAVAFVTDVGGITCHAAIVARELKKPCIIGTKVATKIFKDGDLVEVNADKGEVRKISQ